MVRIKTQNQQGCEFETHHRQVMCILKKEAKKKAFIWKGPKAISSRAKALSILNLSMVPQCYTQSTTHIITRCKEYNMS